MWASAKKILCHFSCNLSDSDVFCRIRGLYKILYKNITFMYLNFNYSIRSSKLKRDPSSIRWSIMSYTVKLNVYNKMTTPKKWSEAPVKVGDRVTDPCINHESFISVRGVLLQNMTSILSPEHSNITSTF